MSTNYFLDRIRDQIAQDRARCAEHGWNFNVRGPDNHTIGDLVGAIMAIDNAEDARAFYESYLTHLRTARNSGVRSAREAERVAKSNIGWCFGEGMTPERIAMWVATTGSAHPVFGTMAIPPTPEEALEAGRRLGRSS